MQLEGIHSLTPVLRPSCLWNIPPPSSPTGSFRCLRLARTQPTSGPLHLRFPEPAKSFLQHHLATSSHLLRGLPRLTLRCTRRSLSHHLALSSLQPYRKMSDLCTYLMQMPILAPCLGAGGFVFFSSESTVSGTNRNSVKYLSGNIIWP